MCYLRGKGFTDKELLLSGLAQEAAAAPSTASAAV